MHRSYSFMGCFEADAGAMLLACTRSILYCLRPLLACLRYCLRDATCVLVMLMHAAFGTTSRKGGKRGEDRRLCDLCSRLRLTHVVMPLTYTCGVLPARARRMHSLFERACTLAPRSMRMLGACMRAGVRRCLC